MVDTVQLFLDKILHLLTETSERVVLLSKTSIKEIISLLSI